MHIIQSRHHFPNSIFKLFPVENIFLSKKGGFFAEGPLETTFISSWVPCFEVEQKRLQLIQFALIKSLIFLDPNPLENA